MANENQSQQGVSVRNETQEGRDGHKERYVIVYQGECVLGTTCLDLCFPKICP